MLIRALKVASAAVVTLVSFACSDTRTPVETPANQASADAHQGAAVGFTDGWQDGRTVSFFFSKPFFCAEPPASGAPSQCEVGEDGTVDPRPGKIPVLYVMTPTGFTPPAGTLHCPIAGNCINHPSTIDLSRVFGPGFADVLLPPHSHIIDTDLPESQANGGEAGWWEIHVIGVSSLDAWNKIVAGKSLAAVRSLQAADPAQAHITADILTNVYLFFDVRP